MNDENIKEIQKILGVKFKNLEMLKTAFVHCSYVNEHRDENVEHNERLEFLGDAVLELISTEYLYEKFPDKDEGALTSYRSALVKGESLAKISTDLGLGKYLLLSRGEEKSSGRSKDYILANLLEAIIGAIYLEHGYKKAAKFVHEFVIKRLDEIIAEGLYIDAKSLFQELSQEKYGVTPFYKLISDDGPDHAKNFRMGAYIGDEKIADGEGSSKQKAEESAARNSLKAKKWI